MMPDISAKRLSSQQITKTKWKKPGELVAWMGAMQAQDYAMAKWAIGLRLKKATDTTVEQAIDKGEIIRTHVLRPTWHFVAAADLHWMIELTAPQIRAYMKSNNKTLELTEKIFSRSHAVIEKILLNENHCTREEIVAALQQANIATDNNRAAHLLVRAELDGIVCSGTIRDGKQTYALLDERVKKTGSISREEALAKLALVYFSSHCPATLRDFTWWSGLNVKDSKQALEMVKEHFVSETIGKETYWFTKGLKAITTSAVHLLPAFDEFLIGYKSRFVSLPAGEQKRTVSDNGIFWPLILVDGMVAGTWKRTMKKDKVIIEPAFFQRPTKAMKELVSEAAEPYGAFTGKKVELLFS